MFIVHSVYYFVGVVAANQVQGMLFVNSSQ
jgi:hypothetical protein